MRKSLLLVGTIVAWLPIQTIAAPYAMVARSIHLNGYNLFIDSFNSSDPLRSTDGHYDPLKGGSDTAVVASEAGILNANNVGVVNLWGRLETGLPYILEIGVQSSIGSVSWHQAGQLGVEPGYHTTNAFPMFPDVPMPYLGMVPVAGTYNGVAYTFVLGNGDYELPTLTLSGGQRLLVHGSARLAVRGNINLSGNSQVVILPTAALHLYVGGTTANLRGGGVVNQGVARNFYYFGTTNNATLNLRVTTPFVGVIYAPEANVSISGAGNVTADFQGAAVANSIGLGSNVDFHFDEVGN